MEIEKEKYLKKTETERKRRKKHGHTEKQRNWIRKIEKKTDI